MAELNVRNLDPLVHAKLRLRAAETGKTMDAEVRAILAAAVAEPGPRRASRAELDSIFERLSAVKTPSGVTLPGADAGGDWDHAA